MKKSEERLEEPLGTMFYQTNSKRSPPFWLLIGARKTQVFWHQSEARTAATRLELSGLVKHCPQGLFWLFFTFLRALFFRPFRLSLAPTICPWVSEDDGSLGRLAADCSNMDNFPPNKPGLTRWWVTRIQNLGSCLMCCQFLVIMVTWINWD